MHPLNRNNSKEEISFAPIPSVTAMKHEERILLNLPIQYALERRPRKKTPSEQKTIFRKLLSRKQR